MEESFFSEKQWERIIRHYSLTPREGQVARLLLQGLTARKIAGMLRIMPGTVKTHTNNTYRKAEAGSKIQMLLRFAEAAGGLDN